MDHNDISHNVRCAGTFGPVRNLIKKNPKKPKQNKTSNKKNIGINVIV